MSERTLTTSVWGKDHKVTVYQKSKTVWVAVGDYMGQQLVVQDRSEGTALKRWREAAKHRGNP
jgi:hypothetical protein